ncbi:DUF2254 domain-containing protein [Vibrio sp.]|nr:DUF2254 domain-containing protein [Vibrio sp.]
MIKRIRLLLVDSAWFVPFLYGVGGFVLTIFTHLTSIYFRHDLPHFIYIEKDSAASLLTASFTSLMTMMTFSFSTILMVLTTYSSQFSPRTINNFLTNSTAKHTLGLFILTTIYGISNLFLIRAEQESSVIASVVIVALVILSIWAFVKFIQTISVSIQAERLLSTLHREALSVIHEQRETLDRNDVFIDSKPDGSAFDSVPIYAEKTGYIQLFLKEKLADSQHDFESYVAVGDFVAKGDILGYWKCDEMNAQTSLFTIGENRSSIQDPSFVVEKLAEVALKAISPGINDPNTAIHAIHYIGDVLRELAEIPDGDFIFKSDDCSWHMKRKPMGDILFDTFASLKSYANKDIFVLAALFDALRIAQVNMDKTHHIAFKEIIAYLEDTISWEELHCREKQFLKKKLGSVSQK